MECVSGMDVDFGDLDDRHEGQRGPGRIVRLRFITGKSFISMAS
ncbi:MAG TPA: hypothetical protein VGF26_04705 [Ramlibacter sp.]